MQYSRRPPSAFDELLALALGDEPTERLPAVRVTRPITAILPQDTGPILPTDPFTLPVDKAGRTYLQYVRPWNTEGQLWEDTLYHVEDLCERFRKQTGSYPTEICLCAQRYFVRRIDHFYPRLMRARRRIPYIWEWRNVGHYEVLVRGIV